MSGKDGGRSGGAGRPEERESKGEELAEDEKRVLTLKGMAVVGLMGAGSYSRVLRCSREAGPDVAVKIIDRSKASSRFLNHFLPRELAIARRLEHPNLARTLDTLTVLNKTYVVMELAEDGDMEQYLSRNGAIPDRGEPNDLPRSLFRQALQGVQHMHSLGIVHRDIKIENFFLCQGMRLKVGDFGFSREMGEEDLSKTFCGSKAYASPELLQQRPYRGRLSDAWALGVAFFTMLECKMPFDDRDTGKMLRRQLARQIPYSRKSKQPARSLVSGLLCPEPEGRLSPAQALRHPFFLSAAAPLTFPAANLPTSSQPT